MHAAWVLREAGTFSIHCITHKLLENYKSIYIYKYLIFFFIM